MALTLPYPSMNFVPLDILTAAEQNQLVANIEYIANQFPITSANIGSQAVKSDNIDWSTYGFGPGDSVIVTDNFLGQMTNLASASQNSLGYVVVRLPKPFKSTVTSISCNTFSLNEIDDIDYAATSRTVTVLNAQSQSVGRNHTTLTATVNTISGDSNSVAVTFKLKDGYSWGGAAQSYHAVMIRLSSLTLTFS